MQPEKVFRVGPNTASIFRNDYGYTVNLQRRFKEASSDQWKSSSYFRLSDLPQVALLVQWATDCLATLEAGVEASHVGGSPAGAGATAAAETEAPAA